MPSSVFFGMQHLNNNMLCAVKVNPITKGGEPFEICILPLNHMLEVHTEILMFNLRMRPRYPENVDWDFIDTTRASYARTVLDGFESDKVADMLSDWFNMINMPEKKRIIPLAHNWIDQKQSLIEWMGPHNFASIFSDDYRDTLVATHYLNDKHAAVNEPVPFSKQNLMWISKQLHCERINQRGGDPVHDCYQIAQVYKRLLQGV